MKIARFALAGGVGSMTPKMCDALDIRLMRILLVLLTTCSVSKTAEHFGQTQPTASLWLRRLRTLLKDPLLVRNGNRLVPSERGVELREVVQKILDEIDNHFSPKHDFDPRQTVQHFRVLASNCFGAIFWPRLLERFRKQAPQATIEVDPMLKPNNLVSLLGNGSIDLIMGNWPEPPPQLRFAPLLSTETVCIVRSRHPLARKKRLTMAEYLELDHLSPSMNRSISPIDGRLLDLGLTRRIVASVPEYSIIPHVLLQSDLIFTTGQPFADHNASTMPLAVIEAPPEFGYMNFYLLWHERSHHSPAHRWLRDLMREVAVEFNAIQPSPVRRQERTVMQ